MHHVSPVRVRIESCVRNPMTATNFEDAYNNTNKSKKRVQIGTSTVFKEKEPEPYNQVTKNKKPTTNKVANNKSCPIIRKKTSINQIKEAKPSLNKHATKPARSRSQSNPPQDTKPGASGCSTCIESRSRSGSRASLNNPSEIFPTAQDHLLNENLNKSGVNNISTSSCSLYSNIDSCNSSKRRVCSLSPIRPAWNDCESHSLNGVQPNLTYTMFSSRSRSCDSTVRDLCENDRPGPIPLAIKSMHPVLPPPICHGPPPLHINPTISHNRESLCKKLLISEESIDEIARQLTMLKDYLATNSPHHFLNPHTLVHIENERNRLIANLDLFELSNRELKETICAINSPACMNNIKLMEENQVLSERVDCLEAEKNHYKSMLMELETNVYRNGNTNEALNLENNALANLKMSLEDNRAHLRRQLTLKESDINRLNVQIKDMSKKLEKANTEIDLLRAGRQPIVKSSLSKPLTTSSAQNPQSKKANNNLYNHNKNAKLVKQYFNLEEILGDQQKTKLYIEKLNAQIAEKDNAVKHMNMEVEKYQKQCHEQMKLNAQNKNNTKVNTQHSDSDERTATTHTTSTSNSAEQKSARLEKHQAEKLRKENEKLKTHIQVKDDKLKNAEAKIKKLEKLHKSMTQANPVNKQPTKRTEQDTVQTLTSNSSDEGTNNMPTYNTQTNPISNNNRNNNYHLNDSITDGMDSSNNTIQRTKNFSEQELNSVRSRLQERLNDLEPLPELLKNTEFKLHDALIKLKNFEIESLESKRSVNDLKYELDMALANNTNLMEKLRETTNNLVKPTPISNQININSARLNEPIDLKSMEENTKKKLLDNLRASKLEPIEKRIQMLEEENREMHRQISAKEELIRELTSKLAMKSNEAQSFSRQLDMAMSDGKIKEQHLKEKLTTKERQWSNKCSELETKLNSLQFSTKSDKRDKEELTHDYSIQVKDLKARLEQAQATNKQMQDYVNFLKNSYMSYFNENSYDNYDMGCNSTLYGIKSQNNLF